jgi:hypothetical protein
MTSKNMADLFTDAIRASQTLPRWQRCIGVLLVSGFLMFPVIIQESESVVSEVDKEFAMLESVVRVEPTERHRKKWKDCHNVCLVQDDLGRYGADLLQKGKLLERLTAEREKLVHKLQEDYGEQYYRRIFEYSPDGGTTWISRGRNVVRMANQNGHSFASLKRKMMLKVLSAQLGISEERARWAHCSCRRGKSQGRTGRRLGEEDFQSDFALHKGDGDTTAYYSKYVWVTGGDG